jgi:hypothetical protein
MDQPVNNQDLWKQLIKDAEYCYSKGVDVYFLHIPRYFNTLADEAAKEAALFSEDKYFRPVRF